MLRGSDNANRRRVRRDTSDVVSRDKIPNYPGMDFNLTSHARIKADPKLAGNDLYHFEAAWLVDLAGSYVEGVIARFLPVQFDFGIDVLTVGCGGRCAQDRAIGFVFAECSRN